MLQSAPHWTIILLLVICTAFGALFLGHFPAVGDMRNLSIPLEIFYQEELQAGRLPVWDENAAFGFPVLASAQVGFYYPPLLFTRAFLPIQIYLPIILIGHALFLAIGTFKFAQRLELKQYPATFTAISFTLGTFVIEHIVHLNVIMTLAWLPWQLLVAHKVSKRPKQTVRQLVLFAMILGTPFLAGQIQIPIMTAIVTSAYFLYNSPHYIPLRKAMKIILIVAIVSFLIASAQLLPTAELAQNSQRSSSGEFNITTANQHSFPLYHLPTTLFPRFYSSDDNYWGKRLQLEYGISIGTLPILLAGWYVFQKKKDKQTKFFTSLLAVSFLLSLGNLSPFRIIGIEPTLWIFSAPARWNLFTTLSMAILAGFALQRIQTSSQIRAQFTRTLTTIAIILTTGILIFNAMLFKFPIEKITNSFSFDSAYTQQKITSLLNSAQNSSISLASPWTWLTLIAIATGLASLKQARLQTLFLGITAIELILLSITLTPTYTWKDILSPPSTIADLPESIQTGNARFFSVREGGDTGAYFTNPESRGGESTRALNKRLIVPLQNSIYNLPGIEWPASLVLYRHEPVLEEMRGESYVIQNYDLARELNIGAYLIPASLDTQPEQATTTTGDINIHTLNATPRASVGSGTVRYEQVTPQHIRLHVDTPRAEKLVIRNSYYPDWKLLYNDIEIPVERSQEIFSEAQVPSGQYILNFRYQPKTAYIGLFITTLTLVATVITLFYSPKLSSMRI